MKRRRFFETLTAALLAVLMIGNGLAFAQGKGNKPPKDDGGGGGGTTEPPPVQYALTYLPTLSSGMDVRDTNEFGDMVGTFTGSDGDLRGFLYRPSLGMVDANSLLPEESPWELRAVNAINNDGVMVASGRRLPGDGLPGDMVSRPLRLTMSDSGLLVDDLGKLVDDLGKFQPDDLPLTRGINDAGEICGLYLAADGTKFIWYYSDGTGMRPVDVGTFGNLYQPLGINNCGQIFGSLATEVSIAYRVIPGEEPERFSHDDTMYVDGFNDLGEFVGSAFFLESEKRKNSTYWSAYRHDGVDFHPLNMGTHRATDINNYGDMVGRLNRNTRDTSSTTDPGQVFLYIQAVNSVIDLDDAIVGAPEDLALWFQDDTAPLELKIDDSGVIIGEFEVRDGRSSPIPFVLTPLP